MHKFTDNSYVLLYLKQSRTLEGVLTRRKLDGNSQITRINGYNKPSQKMRCLKRKNMFQKPNNGIGLFTFRMIPPLPR